MEKEKQAEKDYAELIDLLNKYQVDYLIVGAYAVIQHTKVSRDTKNIDFWIRNTKDNAEKCSKVIMTIKLVQKSKNMIYLLNELSISAIEHSGILFRFSNERSL